MVLFVKLLAYECFVAILWARGVRNKRNYARSYSTTFTKRLGIENKEVLAKAKELGISCREGPFQFAG